MGWVWPLFGATPGLGHLSAERAKAYSLGWHIVVFHTRHLMSDLKLLFCFWKGVRIGVAALHLQLGLGLAAGTCKGYLFLVSCSAFRASGFGLEWSWGRLVGACIQVGIGIGTGSVALFCCALLLRPLASQCLKPAWLLPLKHSALAIFCHAALASFSLAALGAFCLSAFKAMQSCAP